MWNATFVVKKKKKKTFCHVGGSRKRFSAEDAIFGFAYTVWIGRTQGVSIRKAQRQTDKTKRDWKLRRKKRESLRGGGEDQEKEKKILLHQLHCCNGRGQAIAELQEVSNPFALS